MRRPADYCQKPPQGLKGNPAPRAVCATAAIIVFAALAAYSNSLKAPFLFDDIASIANNPTIRHFGTALFPPRAGGLTVSGRPVVNLSLAINYAISGTQVWSYHAINLLIHVCAGLALFGIVRRTLERIASTKVGTGVPPVRSLRTSLWSARTGGDACPYLVAAAIALLWTLHPLQTESVTYIIQRAESLMGLFYLLTLYCFIRGSAELQPAPSDSVRAEAPHYFWHSLAVLSCLLGMATKEVMVSAPVIVFLYDRTFISGSFREAWRRHRFLHLALAATWILLAALVASTGGNRGGSVGAGIGVSWIAYWLTQFHAIVHYLGLSFYPHPLVFDYRTEWAQAAGQIVPYAAIVAALALGTLIALRRRPAIGFLGACFFAILAPTSIMPGPTQPISEQRMYLPLAAVLAAAVVAAPIKARRAIAAMGLTLAAVLGLLTWNRNQDYRSPITLWQSTLAHSPGNERAELGLANALAEGGRLNESVSHYEAALRLQPDYPSAHTDYANVLAQMGHPAEAMAHYEAAVRLKPASAEIRNDLACSLADAGRTTEAIAQFQESLSLNPGYPEAHFNLGNVLLSQGRSSEGISHLAATLQNRPGYPGADLALANALSNAGRTREALPHYEAALRLNPRDAEAQNNLGSTLAGLGQIAEAIPHFEAALKINPDYAEARRNLDLAHHR